jgi:hypothetical protein
MDSIKPLKHILLKKCGSAKKCGWAGDGAERDGKNTDIKPVSSMNKPSEAVFFMN